VDEAATFGVMVNAIAAGIFDTELAHDLPERLVQKHSFWTSVDRMGHPAELAEIAAFMVSDRYSFMNGEVVIVDASYREVARVRAGNGRHVDLHECLLTPQGTALVTCYPQTVDMDLSAAGGSRSGQVLESIIQEIDVRTGRVLFEWRSLEHVGIEESYLPTGGLYDYLHVNSIDVTPDGRLLVSARHTCAIYKLTRRGGRVIWRLGGKRSDFWTSRGTPFALQHASSHLPLRTIQVFAHRVVPSPTHPQSRMSVLHAYRSQRKVDLTRTYYHPHTLLAPPLLNSLIRTTHHLTFA